MSAPPDTVCGQLAALAAGSTSSRALVERALARAAHAQPRLNALISSVGEERALAAADAADYKRRAGRAGALEGLPYAHKDLFCTAGHATTCGSRMLEHFVPPYSAAIHERIAAAGGVLVGKSNMDEFAMGSSNEHSHFGPARNPWDNDRVPGGSSGGSAALVAARVLPFATASDTGGSIRQPAALCGVTGIKPSYGRVSRWGMVAYASSLDQAGVIATTVEDCARVLDVMAGFDPRDATSARQPPTDAAAALARPLAGLRIGRPRQWFGAGIEDGVGAAVENALAQYADAGASIVDIDLPGSAWSIPAYYVIAPAEASSNLARFDGVRYGHRCKDPKDLADLYRRSRTEGFGHEVQKRILAGTYALSSGYYDAYYLRAQKVRRLIADDFARAFAQVDVLAGPTSPMVAFRLGEKLADPLALYLADVNTVGVNLAGLPAMSVPCGFSQGLPVGLQLVAPHWREDLLYSAGHGYQQISDWHRAAPAGYTS
ncbi:MAG: Asp-tRNA(Asn)/Glu-tRNA(Gln) amidotransferase subunit GatA [Xanthomonadales bacterium]|nr:Asp-tRNA(Asn)/Glu-tRNA(Gln) amidotransferase subunit GatA [Xanthomonadales bacterium]MCE7929826.1 Asp-tRNA(Asn)/Glu-tRNA(Gln) amidotransferase subunit GatA [Xanthomonadales bacterium PRO6]